MDNRRPILLTYGLVALGVLLLVCLVWLNYRFISKLQTSDDFATYWIGTRALLKQGANPYSEAVQTEIQNSSSTLSSSVNKTGSKFNVPLYSEALLLPFGLIENYEIAKTIWITALEAAIFLITWLGIRLTGWRPPFPILLVVFIFVYTWLHSLAALLSGNMIIWVTLFITFALQCIHSKLDELAGLSLAMATIIPHAVVLLILYIFFWSTSCRRWRLFVWTLGSILLFFIGASLFLPGWIVQYLRLVVHPFPPQQIDTPGAAFLASYPGLGRQMGWALTILCSLVLIVEWFVSRGKEYRWFVWTAYLTLVISPWIGIPTNPVYVVMLLPAILFILAKLDEHWGSNVNWLNLAILGFLFVGYWLPFIGQIQTGLQLQNYPILLLPLPFLLLIGLYWIRWWSIRPPRLFIAELRAREEYQ